MTLLGLNFFLEEKAMIWQILPFFRITCQQCVTMSVIIPHPVLIYCTLALASSNSSRVLAKILATSPSCVLSSWIRTPVCVRLKIPHKHSHHAVYNHVSFIFVGIFFSWISWKITVSNICKSVANCLINTICYIEISHQWMLDFGDQLNNKIHENWYSTNLSETTV